MCKFFSSVSDGKGKFMYFDSKLRKKCLSGKLNYEPDSHTSIADYFGYKGVREDVLNKYEYNPLTKVFEIDQLNTKDDSGQIKEICLNLDFKKIIPELIIKEIVNPLELGTAKVYKKDIELLKKWASVWASVGGSVRDSVRDSVWASVRDSVWDSVGDSVGASVWAYTSSFFNLEKWKYIEHKKGVNPFQSAIDLWERGLVPSFDGKLWRLHGKGGKILWEGKVVE